MEKLSWKPVRHNQKAGHLPNLRWGHSCAIVEDQVVFFGGYADSSYMNDLWSFNTITMEWNEIATTGDIPSHRSNCSMHYDRDNDRLILFGGGGANKQRFNTINILNWKSKEWIEISPKTNETAPWARTYHTAELFYPYLVVYGGEGVSDLDDLWVFNFITMCWTEVPFPNNAIRPCARRFHSSAQVGNQLYIIAGCHAKYRCLSDIYSIDLTSLIETGSVDNLQWRERKMRDNTFLTRWGHTSTVYDDKIYVFGGRFCNDLNDILILDTQKDLITTAKIAGQIPKARRRHSACFLGSSMLIFGGFNGEYFNDLHYISIVHPKKRYCVNYSSKINSIKKLSGLKTLQWMKVTSKEGTTHEVCKGLVAHRFRNQESLQNFIQGIREELSSSQLLKLIQTLYNGYGKVDNQLVYQYGMNLYDSKEEMEHDTRKTISHEDRQNPFNSKRPKSVESILILEDFLFREFIQRKRSEESYSDVTFALRNSGEIRSNRALLALGSQYFKTLVSGDYLQKERVIPVPFSDVILFEVMLNYVTSGFVVTSKDYGHQFWVMLAEMAQYYSLNTLLAICEQQLLNRITQFSCQQLLVIAIEMSLSQLAKGCAEQIIRNMINQQKEDVADIFPQVKNQNLSILRQQVLKDVYATLRFDILQKKIDTEEKEAKIELKSVDSANNQNQQEEKENNETRL